RAERQALRSLARRDAENAHFGRGIEAEAEQKPKQIHVPAPLDQTKEIAKNATEYASLTDELIELHHDKAPTACHRMKGPVDLDENECVGSGNCEEKEYRYARTDHAADIRQNQIATRQRRGA